MHQAHFTKIRSIKTRTRSMRTEENYLFNGKIRLLAVKDHILESQCQCESTPTTSCLVCKYEHELPIPHLPEMIFPHNRLVLALRLSDGTETPFLQFNAFDALTLVQVGQLPDVKVKPTAVWQSARKEMPMTDFQKLFDWTYTTLYKGTLLDDIVKEEPTDEEIDYEKLKQRESILFYSQMTLFEDELSDHGNSQMTVRVRVMPNSFFILCRFYLRVDGVMVRMHDARLYAEADWPYVLRECSRREAAYEQIAEADLQNVLDANLIWPALPQISMERNKLTIDHR